DTDDCRPGVAGSSEDQAVTKAHILDEIRRTALANGGEPLGWRRVAKETGIKLGDLARVWGRVGDAGREAGHAPKGLRAAYSNAALLSCLAELARKLGRLPAWSDLKLAHYSDPPFPSEKVFRRFESKEELVRQLTEHCRAEGGWEDVVTLCACYTP